MAPIVPSQLNGQLNVQTLAAAGSVLGDAGAIGTKSPGFINVTGANGTTGVRLPPASAGKMFIVKNNAGSTLKVWPATASQGINAVSAGSAFSMLTVTSCIFIALNSTTWLTVPLVAS